MKILKNIYWNVFQIDNKPAFVHISDNGLAPDKHQPMCVSLVAPFTNMV